MRLGHRTIGVIVSIAACVAPFSVGTAQAATAVGGASATVLSGVIPEPVIVLSTIASPNSSSSSGAPASVTLTAVNVNVAPRADGASLSGTVTLGDSAPVVAMQASEGRAGPAKAAEAGGAAAASGTLGNSRALAVELSKADLAALGGISVTLNYN